MGATPEHLNKKGRQRLSGKREQLLNVEQSARRTMASAAPRRLTLLQSLGEHRPPHRVPLLGTYLASVHGVVEMPAWPGLAIAG